MSKPQEFKPDQLIRARAKPQNRYLPAQEFSIDAVRASLDAEENPQVSTPAGSVNSPSKPWLGRAFLVSLMLLISLLFTRELYLWLSWGFQLSVYLGSALALVLGSFFLLLILSLGRAYLSRRRLNLARALREQAQALLLDTSSAQTDAAFVRWRQALQDYAAHTELEAILAQAWTQCPEHLQAHEALQRLSMELRAAVDARGIECISRNSLVCGALVSASPLVSFDMLLVLWRNWRMMRELSRLYGVSNQLPAQLSLLKQVLQAMALMGVSELALELSQQTLAASAGALVSARLGQGVGAGLLTARIGLKTLEMCRPLPWSEADQPSLQTLQKTLFKQLSELLSHPAEKESIS
ncbi:TIGR01620 family protein [Nitrincola tapanii]|nr:TIGR01620 family protein [Nitrincola tapanii]